MTHSHSRCVTVLILKDICIVTRSKSALCDPLPLRPCVNMLRLPSVSVGGLSLWTFILTVGCFYSLKLNHLFFCVFVSDSSSKL